MDIKKYLSRIGISENEITAPSYELLKKLQYKHVLSVPYENLDIISGKPLSLEVEDIYNKVVICGRGGYCFELNCLFEELLKKLGFKTVSYFARFWRGETTIPQRRHRVVAVDIGDKRYIADVGIGSVAPRIPILLEDGAVTEFFGESYRFMRDEEFGWILYELTHGEWKRYFSFTEDKAQEIDFVMPSFYCEKHADSKFNKGRIVAVKTEDGRRSIDGDVYKEFLGAELVYTEEIKDNESAKNILRTKFNIQI